MFAGVALGMMVLAAEAADVTWKGGGNTSAWSDGSNWDGGSAPGLGDIAVLPSGAIVRATIDDIDYAEATKLGGIHFSGDDTVLVVANVAEARTFDIPFSGVGEFRVLDCTAKLTMKADNSSYMGSFVVSNAYVGYSSPSCMGTTNRVDYWGSASNSPIRYFAFDANQSSTNEFHLHDSEWRFSGAYGARVCGPVYLHGSARVEGGGNEGDDKVFELLGGVYRVDGSNGIFKPGNNCRLGGEKPVRLAVDEKLMCDRGILRIATDIERAWKVSTKGTIVFERANCISPSVMFQLGDSTRYGCADLCGNDQRCGDFAVHQANMDSDRTWLYSEDPATFTVCGSGPADFNGLLMGALSLELNSTNSATAGSIGLSGTNSTSGAIIARRGAVTVLSAATFPNLTELVASDEGVVNLQMAAKLDSLRSIKVSGSGQVNFGTECLNDGLAELEISDSGVVTLCGGSYRFYALKTGDRYRASGTYEVNGSVFGGAITGTGVVTVLTRPVTYGTIIIVR